MMKDGLSESAELGMITEHDTEMNRDDWGTKVERERDKIATGERTGTTIRKDQLTIKGGGREIR